MFIKFLQIPMPLFSADGGDGGGGSAAADQPGGDSSDTSWIDDLYSGDDSDKESMIPKSRFDSVNSKYKELANTSKTLTADHEALQAKYAEAEGSLKTSTERVEALEAVLKGLVDAELEQIDESYHDLIPTDKSIEQQLDWIVKAKQKGVFGMGRGNYEYEIGGMSNPGNGSKQGSRNTQGLNPLQLFQMGYGK